MQYQNQVFDTPFQSQHTPHTTLQATTQFPESQHHPQHSPVISTPIALTSAASSSAGRVKKDYQSRGPLSLALASSAAWPLPRRARR